MKDNFKYSETGGLMSITHFRFFDWIEAQKMINDTGFNIIIKEASGNFPLLFFRKLLPGLGKTVYKGSLRKCPGLFGFQFVFVCKKSA